LLYTYLVPEDFHRMIDSGKPLKLILTAAPRRTPWEMACFRARRTRIAFRASESICA
jgi:hypothetical protein